MHWMGDAGDQNDQRKSKLHVSLAIFVSVLPVALRSTFVHPSPPGRPRLSKLFRGHVLRQVANASVGGPVGSRCKLRRHSGPVCRWRSAEFGLPRRFRSQQSDLGDPATPNPVLLIEISSLGKPKPSIGFIPCGPDATTCVMTDDSPKVQRRMPPLPLPSPFPALNGCQSGWRTEGLVWHVACV